MAPCHQPCHDKTRVLTTTASTLVVLLFISLLWARAWDKPRYLEAAGGAAAERVISGNIHQESSGYTRTLVVGDVHGCKDELLAVLQKANYNPQTDSVVLLGDVIGKGPSPHEVIRLARGKGKGWHMLLGNHEYGFLRLVEQLQNHDRHTELSLSERLELRCIDPLRVSHTQFRLQRACVV